MRVGLYLRVSSAEQKNHGLSVDSQLDALKKYCEDNSHTIVSIYNDAGFSASKSYKKRPALQEMISDCQGGKIDLLLFTKLDRFFRSVKDYYACTDQMNNIPWRAIWEDYETETSSGRFKVNIMLSIAEAESSRTSERIKAVNEYRRAKGNFIGGRAPRGYKTVRKEDKTVIIEKDEAEKESIELFFQTYLDTFSPRQASKALCKGQDGISHRTVISMLKNRAYMGDAHGSKCEPYITEEQFEIIQNSLDGRRIRTPHRNDRIYIFSGLLRCGTCGHNMGGAIARAKSAGVYLQYKSYRCNSFNNNSGCPNTAVTFESKLERYLLENLEALIADREIQIENDYADSQNTENKIAQLESRLDRIGIRFEIGDYTKDEYISKRNEIKKEIDELKKLSQVKPTQITLPNNWKDMYNELDDPHKKAFWNNIIKKITIYGTRAKDRTYRVDFI